MKKMKLDDLKVNSFVTSMEGPKAQTAKGGLITITIIPITISIYSALRCK